MIRIGIIGCGKIAQSRHIPEYAARSEVKLAGFYDLNQERAKKLADEYGAKAYLSEKELIEDTNIDVVSVCTANHTHAEMTIAALRAGKHVLCEKPMAVTLKECEEMVRAAEEEKRYLMIGHNQRLARSHIKAKELIDNGEIGRIITARTTFGHGGPENWSVDSGKNVWFFDKKKAAMGVMGDLGIHKTDLLQFLCSSRICRVTARLVTLDKEYEDGTPVDVDDNAYCIYEMENGIVAVMHVSWTFYGTEDNSTILYGTEGIMRIYDDPCHSIVVIKHDGEKYMYDIDTIQTNANQTRSGVIDSWVECLLSEREPEISGSSVLAAMKAVFAAMKSSQEQKTVAVEA